MSLSEKLFLVAQWLICSNSGAKGSGLNLPQRLGIDEKGPTKTTTYLRSVCSCLKNRKIVFLEPFPASFYLFSYFQYISSLIKLVVILRICQWLDSNRGSLVGSDRSPTSPQPLAVKLTLLQEQIAWRWIIRIQIFRITHNRFKSLVTIPPSQRLEFEGSIENSSKTFYVDFLLN